MIFYCEQGSGPNRTGLVVVEQRNPKSRFGDYRVLSKYFLHTVAYLASEKMQDKYMVHATKDNYLLPEELMNDAFGAVERVKMAQNTRFLNQSLKQQSNSVSPLRKNPTLTSMRYRGMNW
ncbi:MAG: hypothetical protein ACYSWP_01990 [Planctomycetota bacterium]